MDVYAGILCDACNSRGRDLVVEDLHFQVHIAKATTKKAIKTAWCELDSF